MKANRHLRIAVGLYGIIWVLSAITFWLFYKNSQMAMLHVIVVQYVVMPVVTLISSIFVGRAHLPTKYVWLMPVCFSVFFRLELQEIVRYRQMMNSNFIHVFVWRCVIINGMFFCIYKCIFFYDIIHAL